MVKGFFLCPSSKALVDHFHRDFACYIAGLVASHTIGYNVQAEGVLCREKILISFSYLSNVSLS